MSNAASDGPSDPSPAGVDVGGTFTDFLVATTEGLRIHKEPTSRPQHKAVVDGLVEMDVSPTAPLVHGTTTATNALLERRGARTALVTTEGFGDVLVIGRQNRPDLYDLQPTRPEPLVPDERRFEVPERLDEKGTIMTPLDESDVQRVAEQIRRQEVESVAVVFLFSYRNSEHEERVARMLSERLPDASVTTSSALLPEYREYERTATTVVNAYVRPQVARYLGELDEAVGERTVRVMQSNGGTIGLDTAADEAARLALSGPAGGIAGAIGVARRALDSETPKIMTLDMGGTSADVALCDGSVPYTTEHTIADLPLRLPATDIHTVGAGGGSIARVDAGGSLRVGPESAGANPGPVCYGRGGTEPTVTDAHLVLGRLDTDWVLGGAETLDMAPEAARSAVASLADSVDLSVEEAALGVLRVANATMERALRRVSVERGHDPREYTLVPFGGAGPLHAVALAEALDIPRVLVPPTPGVLSALGLLMADIEYDAARAVLDRADAIVNDPSPLQTAATDAAEDVRSVLQEHGAATLQTELDLRYVGQSYEVRVPVDGPLTGQNVSDAIDGFHETHRARYGHADPSEPVEVVAVRVRGRVETPTVTLPRSVAAEEPVDAAAIGSRPVWFRPNTPTETPTYRRSACQPGHELDGPAVVHQYDTTIVIPPDWHARVDAWKNLWIERRAADSDSSR